MKEALEQIRQQAAAQHARQTAQPDKAVITAHEIAAVFLARRLGQRKERPQPQQRPGQPPETAQQQPDGEGLRHPVQQGGSRSQQNGEQHARPAADAGVQPPHQRIERQTDQTVDRQQHPHLPERIQPALLPAQRQGNVQHGVPDETEGRDGRHDARKTQGLRRAACRRRRRGRTKRHDAEQPV